MKIQAAIEKIVYVSDEDDWEITIEKNEFFLRYRIQNELTFASGGNLDNLATLIRDVKIDAKRKGINWEAQ